MTGLTDKLGVAPKDPASARQPADKQNPRNIGKPLTPSLNRIKLPDLIMTAIAAAVIGFCLAAQFNA